MLGIVCAQVLEPKIVHLDWLAKKGLPLGAWLDKLPSTTEKIGKYWAVLFHAPCTSPPSPSCPTYLPENL
ncbi:MAG: hypothetical protein HOP34_05525 [Methylococcaceae bacterium]|nr:hypothetical protein [Methylococcaceae bacterium]